MNSHVAWYVEEKDRDQVKTPFEKYIYALGSVDKNFKIFYEKL
jgi:hypothetical protein